MRIHVGDSSGGANTYKVEQEDENSAPRKMMSEEEYAARPNTVRRFKEQRRAALGLEAPKPAVPEDFPLIQVGARCVHGGGDARGTVAFFGSVAGKPDCAVDQKISLNDNKASEAMDCHKFCARGICTVRSLSVRSIQGFGGCLAVLVPGAPLHRFK